MDPNLQRYLEQLGASHDFTLEQLMSNRAGQVHPAQVARGWSRDVGFGVFFCFVALLVLAGGVGGALLLYDDMRPPISRVDMNGVYALAAAGVVLGGLIFWAALGTFASVGRRRAAYRRGVCQMVEGPVQKVRIQQRRAADRFGYQIDNQRLYAPNAGWQMVTAGARYRIYFIGDELLSLEPL
jgi:hypothetical protein